MLEVLAALWGSALIGYLLRKWPQPWIGKLLPLTIWLMLFFIGIEVGGNETLTSQLGRLGGEAMAATLICCLFCALASLAFWKLVHKEMDKEHHVRKINEKKSVFRMLMSMKDSSIIVLFFTLGFVIGNFGLGKNIPSNATTLCLYLLLICVGFGLGQNRDLKKNLKSSKKRLLLMPLITLAATFAGAAVTALIFRNHSLSEWMAVGSGFGYYSLSSILITDIKGTELGTIALMYNVFRELLAIIFAPLTVRWAGPLAPISIGGATTADTTLPTISRFCGEEFVPIAIFHGILVDFSVPFLVPFFCSL